MNVVAAHHFNRGQRALFFALTYLGWFVSGYVLMVQPQPSCPSYGVASLPPMLSAPSRNARGGEGPEAVIPVAADGSGRDPGVPPRRYAPPRHL